jgi:hypothetical protein
MTERDVFRKIESPFHINAADHSPRLCRVQNFLPDKRGVHRTANVLRMTAELSDTAVLPNTGLPLRV